MLDDLCNRKLKDINDFEWQRFLRPYLKTVEDSSNPDLDTPSNQSPPATEKEQNCYTVILQCLDQQVEYGFEYLGCARLPALTHRSNNYIIAFTQVSKFVFLTSVTPICYLYFAVNFEGFGESCGRPYRFWKSTANQSKKISYIMHFIMEPLIVNSLKTGNPVYSPM